MKLKSILEDIIAKDKFQIKIDYGVNRTKHSKERQDRHKAEGGKTITNKEIADIVSKAIPKLTGELIKDKIDINKDAVQISDGELNIVGKITPGGSGPYSLNFKIITVMRKKNFYPTKDTKLVIKV